LISTDRLIYDLDDLIGIPGSPGQPEQLALVAARVASMMRTRGLKVDLVPTAGAPLVVGRRAGRHPFTVLLFHHYDAAPPGPWRAWHHEPHRMAERDGVLYGRGVAEGRGPLVAHLNALAALVEAEGELPCGVVVVAEGDRLIGSPQLQSTVAEHAALLAADAVLGTGGDRDAHGVPFCYSGAKGLLQVRLRASGAGQAIPAGLAPSVPNPLWRLVWALAQIKSDQEEILIPGFYDTIDGPSRAEAQALRGVLVNEAARVDAWGIEQFLFGMSRGALVQAEVTLPTCNVSALTVEPPGEQAGIPVGAAARLDFQLVPKQLPHDVAELLEAHLLARGLGDVVAEHLPGAYPAASSMPDAPFPRLVADVGRHVYGAPLSLLPRGSFAQPLYWFAERLGAPVAVLGCARAESGVTAPNEHIPLPDLVRHGQHLIELCYACAQGEAGSEA
jgi:acetylornithine deacetylase/succinyl-diaminopimelate desuccinylase-like protein